jgi:GDP-L-fucose synthase
MISSNSKIYVAGHNGLVGSAILRKLKIKGFKNVIFRSKKQLDLKNQTNVLKFLKRNKPDFIFIAAAKVGGIYSNKKYKAEYIYDNLIIQSNLIHSAYLSGVKNLIFLGSSCIYPRNCKQPIKESYLLTGKLEETNDSYAIAKIAGIKMCESYNAQYKTNYKCLMPTNTFGPNDNYDTMNSHFFPALIKKIHNLKMQNKEKLKLWGNGFAKREVIYVNDLADACIYFMNKKIKETFINIGSGKDYSIKQYARIIINNIIPEKNIKIEYDLSKPNGTPRKILDIKLTSKYGWKAKTNLNQAILETYKNFLSQKV